jgi:hypothetical protein
VSREYDMQATRPRLQNAPEDAAAPVDEVPQLERRAAWRQVAYMDAVSLQHDLEDLCSKRDPQVGNHIAQLLQNALLDVRRKSWPWAWFQGFPQERSFTALHAAQWRLLLIMDSEHLLARLPWLVKYCGAILGADDQRVRDAQEIIERSSHRRLYPQRLQVNGHGANRHTSFRLTEHERATVAAMVRDAYAQSDEGYAATRGLRNRIIVLTVGAASVLTVVIFAAAAWQWSLTPTTNVAVNGTVATWSGSPEPTGAVGFLAISLLGCVGAFLSGIRSVSRTAGSRNPFSLSWWQTWLKLPVGALSAIVGVFALQSRAFPAMPATGWTELLMWAVAFGAAQQAITRFVDSRVRGLVGDARVEDSVAAASPPDHRSVGARKRAVSGARTAQQVDEEDACS